LFDECQIILEDKERAFNKMIKRDTRQNNKNIDKRKAHKIFRQKKESTVQTKLEQMEIAYNNNEAKKLYHEVNSIRKGFKPQTLHIQIRKVL
jgi:transposase-like protein